MPLSAFDKGQKVFSVPTYTQSITPSDTTSISCKAVRVVGTGGNLSYKHTASDVTFVVTLGTNETFPIYLSDGRIMAATTIGTLLAFDY